MGVPLTNLTGAKQVCASWVEFPLLKNAQLLMLFVMI